MPPPIPRSRFSLLTSRNPFNPLVCTECLRKLQRRALSSSPILRTRMRREMFRWLDGPGSVFKQPLPNSTNYLNAYNADGGLVRARGAKPSQLIGLDASKKRSRRDENSGDGDALPEGAGLPRETADDLMPFPMNRNFMSQPVLSEELKDEIFRRVMEEGQDVRTVSAALGVEMSRVGAVVRLKAVESQWVKEGRQLALPYAKAVMSMLPQTPFVVRQAVPHESINDLNVHQDTMRQMFAPTSESRRFTREDAGKTFSRSLLPADKRIPHPELIQIQKWYNEGYQKEEIEKLQRQRLAELAKKKAEKEAAWQKKEEILVKKRETPRWEYRFRDISVESVGKDGRALSGVGERYGFPFEDRKKGATKIPIRVG